MTPNIQDQLDQRGLLMSLPFPEFSVSWAGAGWNDEFFCLGSDEGELAFLDFDGGPFHGNTESGWRPEQRCGEAVNGVAFHERSLAFSTRSEICFLRLGSLDQPQKKVAILPCGAHGVLALGQDGYLSPLGNHGFLLTLGDTNARIFRPTERECNFYKVARMGQPGNEMLAFAARSNGVVTTTFKSMLSDRKLRFQTFDGLDIVDVSSLGRPEWPFALIAAEIDGTFLYWSDVREEAAPLKLTVSDIQGTVYKILCTRDCIVLLTSAGLYVFLDLAARLASGSASANPTHSMWRSELDVIDANLCSDRWLLIVTTDGVLRLDLWKLCKSQSAYQVAPETYVAKVAPMTLPRVAESVDTVATTVDLISA